ncbi:MAG: hypothetical protein ACE5GX_04010 [Thermoanaerobaculia bacterium]
MTVIHRYLENNKKYARRYGPGSQSCLPTDRIETTTQMDARLETDALLGLVVARVM